jgi:hypothetical protein
MVCERLGSRVRPVREHVEAGAGEASLVKLDIGRGRRGAAADVSPHAD